MNREIRTLLSKYKCSRPTLKPNYRMIPASKMGMDEVAMDEFNLIYRWANDNIKNKIVRTRSGGISHSKFRLPSFDVIVLQYCVELTLLTGFGFYRLQFRSTIRNMDQTHSGRQSFVVFKKCLKKYGIDLNDYIIQDGKEIKKTIEIPLIKLARNSFRDYTFNNVHHIDFHSSYPAGIIKYHPEFKEAIEHMYESRKKDPVFKAVLDYSVGFMQSSLCGYRFAHLSRDAIKDNNDRVKELADRITKACRTVLLYNTDGFWYYGDIYHGKGEGEKIGEWSNDHTNCQFRAKSNGCYEYIENGIYHPVVRGRTKLETRVPRENWSWGDIYRNDCVAITYTFDEEKGIIQNENKEVAL